VEHSGTLLAAIFAGGAAVMLVNRADWARSRVGLSLLAGLYAGLYAACNYLTTLMFGPSAQTAIILASPVRTAGIVIGSFLLGTLLGLLACRIMRPLQARVFAPAVPQFGI
jgi:hypothetical protein